MKFKRFDKIYFLGIGGIGMSSIAQFFLEGGKNIAGYDKVKTNLTNYLGQRGAKIHYKPDLHKIPRDFKIKDNTLVIYTPAIDSDNEELKFFMDSGFLVLKRSDILAQISNNKFCIAIAGTHGKTTTSSILSHILFENDLSVSSFVGGISENYNNNYLNNGQKIIVVEADEFDKSFLKLKPDVACITSIDFDHSDVYNTKDELLNSFHEFSQKVKKSGIIIKKYGLPIEGESYGFDSLSNYYISNFNNETDFSTFDINYSNTSSKNVKFKMSGKHNAENALAAFIICKKLNLDDNIIIKSLGSFEGVRRRFTYVLKSPKVLIDDYAHHPVEINMVKKTTFSLFKGKKVTVIFQPHLFSRTRDFMEEFANVLKDFHEIILLEIYPAREKPISGINSNVLLEKINNKNKQLLNDKELYMHIRKSDSDVFLALGAGDIGEKVNSIKNVIQTNEF